MKKIIIIVAIALSTLSAMAHNPLTAKFELSTSSQDFALLNIYLSQTGLHQALIKFYTDIDFETISEKSYKELTVDYIKAHTQIKADDVKLIINEGGIKLGSHQTDLKFLIKNYPSSVDEISVTIDAFKQNENHHTVFWWKDSNRKRKVILSENNAFSGDINLSNTQGVLYSQFNQINYYLIFPLVLMTAMLSFLFLKKGKAV